MNKHGQTLVIFIILLPIFLLFAALVVDIGFLTGEKIKATGITKTILNQYYEERQDYNIEGKIRENYQKNEIDLADMKINTDNDEFKIEIRYSIESIFGKIIGLKEYEIHIEKSIKKE